MSNTKRSLSQASSLLPVRSLANMKTNLGSGSQTIRRLLATLVFTALPLVNFHDAQAAPAVKNPFSGAKLYVNPDSVAKKQANAWRTSQPANAALMDKIASQPMAEWFGDWNKDIQKDVSKRVSTIAAAGALPVLVTYNIPKRDCNSHSRGGTASASAYQSWISGLANGIGNRKAVVILEPDALVHLKKCLSSTEQQTRLSLIRNAITVLKSKPNIAVYVDAGNSNGFPASEMATRLINAGIAKADGFSSNIANYMSLSSELAYNISLSARVGGKHFIIDTSRNGLGPTLDRQWCNPSGRALGVRPTTTTGELLADAYLWIKTPGQSDGQCNGGPAAGVWWPAYALGLAQRAGY